MNKKLPIEEALESRLNNLPVPNEDAAWHDMSRLLDKEKKPRIIFFKRLGILLLLLTLILAGYWQWFQQDKPVDHSLTAASGDGQPTLAGTGKQQDATNQINSSVSSGRVENTVSTNKHSDGFKEDQPAGDNKNKSESHEQRLEQKDLSFNSAKSTRRNDRPASSDDVKERKRSINEDVPIHNNALSLIPVKDDKSIKKNRALSAGKDDVVNSQQVKSKKAKRNTNGKAGIEIIAQVPSSDDVNTPNTLTSSKETNETNTVQELANVLEVPTTDSTDVLKSMSVLKKDSILSKKAVVAKPLDTATTLKRNKSDFVWSAGIGIQQQLPLAGKEFSSYGFNGRNNLLHDYIPSLYLAFEKPQRWFVLAELQFGSPRMVDAFTYSRSTSLNYFEGELSTASLQLKKTFYHKASLGFHHYISKHFSAGAGVDYHLLYRAITESRLTIKQLPDQAETSSSQLLPAGYQDSFLYRSLAGMQVQVNYQWGKFSFGLRYSADLQPFIKYTEPSGELSTRKDRRWEILARYRIWRSGK